MQSVVALLQHEDPDIRSTAAISAFGLDAASQFAMGSVKTEARGNLFRRANDKVDHPNIMLSSGPGECFK